MLQSVPGGFQRVALLRGENEATNLHNAVDTFQSFFNCRLAFLAGWRRTVLGANRWIIRIRQLPSGYVSVDDVDNIISISSLMSSTTIVVIINCSGVFTSTVIWLWLFLLTPLDVIFHFALLTCMVEIDKPYYTRLLFWISLLRLYSIHTLF